MNNSRTTHFFLAVNSLCLVFLCLTTALKTPTPAVSAQAPGSGLGRSADSPMFVKLVYESQLEGEAPTVQTVSAENPMPVMVWAPIEWVGNPK